MESGPPSLKTDVFSLVDCSTKYMKDTTEAVLCAKSLNECPP